MHIALNLVIFLNIIKGIFKAFKDIKIVGLIMIGVLSITLLSVTGIESGRMIISYGIIALSLFLIVFYCKNWIRTKKNLLGIVLLLSFGVFFLLSYLYSPASTSDYGLWKIRQFISLALIPSFLILLVGKVKKKEMSLIENFIVVSSVVASVLLLYNAYNAGGLAIFQSDWFARQSIGAMNPVWLSRFLGLGILVLQAPQFEKKPWLVYPLSMLLIVAALLTGSKTVLYFTLPVVILYKLFRSGISRRLILNLGVVISLIALVAFFLTSINSDAFVNRFSLQSGTIGMREIMQQMTMDAYMAGSVLQQFFGHGGGSVGYSLGVGYIREYPHNLLIEILYELGAFGLFIYLLQFLFAVFLFMRGKRNWVFFAFILHFLFSLTSGDLAANDLVFTMFSLFLVSEMEERKSSETKKRRLKIVWR